MCEETKTIAASWWDGNVVAAVSNADSSNASIVERGIQSKKKEFQAPVCIKEYNKNMQAVDRLDEMRGRFSIANGHSFQKWYKKLAMAFIDIARLNAHLRRKLARPTLSERDPHRSFLIELTRELVSGEWKQLSPDERLLSDDFAPAVDQLMSPSGRIYSSTEDSISSCKMRNSQEQFPDKKRWKRRCCIVCRFEGKQYPTIKTQYCINHEVSLCTSVQITEAEEYYYPNLKWSCWRKF